MPYPRGPAPVAGAAPLEPLEVGKMSVLRRGHDVAIVAIGRMVAVASQAADLLAARGLSATVVDARFAKPVDPDIAALAAHHRALISVEEDASRRIAEFWLFVLPNL